MPDQPGVAAAGSVAPETSVEFSAVKVVFALERAEVVPFRDLSFRVPEGAFWSIIGPSGCGKSTLLRVIADLIAPAAGTVGVFGTTPAESRRRRDIAFVFQEATLLPWRTVLENVRLPLEVGRSRAAGRQGYGPEALLELVGLSKWHHALPQQLSGGMRQRVAIARALVCQPRLLLMDEPFGALDELIRDELNDELLRIWAETGTTILFGTHSLTEAAYLSQRILVMRAGAPANLIDGINPGRGAPSGGRRESMEYVRLVSSLRQLLRGRGDDAR